MPWILHETNVRCGGNPGPSGQTQPQTGERRLSFEEKNGGEIQQNLGAYGAIHISNQPVINTQQPPPNSPKKQRSIKR